MNDRARDRRKIRSMERRAATRWPATTEVLILETPNCRQRVKLVEISRIGCRVETGFALKAGVQTALIVAGFDGFAAEIVWSDTAHAGLRFEKPIHPAVVRHIATMAEPVDRRRATMP